MIWAFLGKNELIQQVLQCIQVMFYTVVALVRDCMLLKHYVSVTGVSCNMRLKISTEEHVSQARCVFMYLMFKLLLSSDHRRSVSIRVEAFYCGDLRETVE